MNASTQAAYQMDGATVARAQFYATACHPGRSVVVEACAGAGKTWMLVSRIVRALLDGARPHEILAITFTRKAAAEMRERLVDWLRAWSASAATPEQRILELCARGMSRAQARAAEGALAALNAELLRCGRMVEIRTFHAWFSQLLRGAPLELLAQLQLSPNMRLLEEATDHEPAIFRRFHARVLADEVLCADYHAQVHLRGRASLQRWLQLALGKRIEIELAHRAGVLEASVEPPGDGQACPYAAIRDPELNALLQSLMRKFNLQLKQGMQQTAARNLVQALALSDDREAFAAVYKALMTDKQSPRKRLGDHPEQDHVCQLLLQLREAQHQLEAHAEHLRMVRLSRVLIEELGAYKREQGLADMADLERCALALLRDSSLSAWMQERLDARVRHVLIDEFQDTSPLQWQALHAWLSGYAGAGGGHSGQQPPSVFIVGDPKQSIYRFRRAEPRVFEAARDFVVQGLGGAVLTCDHTRRNAPEVLDALNAVFERAQSDAAFSGFRAHTTEVAAGGAQWSLYGLPCGVFTLPRAARVAQTQASGGASVSWRDTLTTPRDEPQTLSRQQEAQRVAHAIAALVRGQVPNPRDGVPLKPSDIHVLSRKRASLRLLAQELQALHIPFAAPEAFRLMDSAEVQDVVALLDALASQQHHLSLARALRSPIFGVSDHDLILLAQSVQVLRERTEQVDFAQEVSWWVALMEGPDDGFSPALRRARGLLGQWCETVDRLPPHDVLDRIFDQGEVLERMVAAAPAAARGAAQAALQALMAQALVLDGARYATLYNFVRALKQRALKLMPPALADAVQLLTVHGAKGLEAEVVFIMDADPESQKADHTTVLIDWPVDSPAPTTCAFVYSESRCPPSLTTLLARERAAREREELNGLYVAMTRARECLVISSTERRQASASSWAAGSAGAAYANWWQRLQPCLSPWPLGLGDGLPPEPADARIQWWSLPQVVGGPVSPARQAPTELREVSQIAPLAEPDSHISLVGQAVHLVLQWATHGHLTSREAAVAAAARQFAVPEEQVSPVVARILDSQACAPFFDRSLWQWADNEVAVTVRGRVQRIDRLVVLPQAQGGVCWWVLDYKLHESPQTLPAYREQLLAYAHAVAQLQPGERVRCAFITGQGEVVEVVA